MVLEDAAITLPLRVPVELPVGLLNGRIAASAGFSSEEREKRSWRMPSPHWSDSTQGEVVVIRRESRSK